MAFFSSLRRLVELLKIGRDRHIDLVEQIFADAGHGRQQLGVVAGRGDDEQVAVHLQLLNRIRIGSQVLLEVGARFLDQRQDRLEDAGVGEIADIIETGADDIRHLLGRHPQFELGQVIRIRHRLEGHLDPGCLGGGQMGRRVIQDGLRGVLAARDGQGNSGFRGGRGGAAGAFVAAGAVVAPGPWVAAGAEVAAGAWVGGGLSCRSGAGCQGGTDCGQCARLDKLTSAKAFGHSVSPFLKWLHEYRFKSMSRAMPLASRQVPVQLSLKIHQPNL